MTAELHPMQVQWLKTVETALQNLGCSYYIAAPGQEPVGNVTVHIPPVKKTRPRSSDVYTRGTLRNYLRPFMDDIQVGQVAVIPFGDFIPAFLVQSARSYGLELWGVGACRVMPPATGDTEFAVMRRVGAV